MAREENVHIVQDSALCDGLGAADAFLGRLENNLYGALKLNLSLV